MICVDLVSCHVIVQKSYLIKKTPVASCYHFHMCVLYRNNLISLVTAIHPNIFNELSQSVFGVERELSLNKIPADLCATKWPDFQRMSCLRNLVHSKLN